MKQKKEKSRLRLKIAIAVSLSVIWLIVGMFKYVNSPKVQGMIFASVNKVSSLKIESARLRLDVLKRTVKISNVNLFSPKKNQRFKTNKVSFKFKILPLLKGTINIHDFEVDTLRVDITPATEKFSEEHPRIGLANLLLLKNLSLKNGVIKNITVNANENVITAREIHINFVPSIWGSINLALNIIAPEFAPAKGDPVTADEIDIQGSTNLNKWIDVFPYVDDLSGKIGAKDIKWRRLDVETLDAKLNYSRGKIDLQPLIISVEGHRLELEGDVNSNTQKYSLRMNISEPIYLPSLGSNVAFLDTSGYLGGKLSIDGQGLDYKTTNASATVTATHKLGGAEPLPAELAGQFAIANGQITTKDATLKVGDSPVKVTGSFNYIKPNLNFSFEGDNIPVETVMNRFNNKHYRPTKGVANVTGHFTGWKPDLKFDLTAEASPASYYYMVAEVAKMHLELTYHQLTLSGTIYQDGGETASVDLTMHFGEMLDDGTRRKSFQLTAKVNDHDLESTMKEYGLAGTGNGEMTLGGTIAGTVSSYQGSGKATIADGSFKGIDFKNAETDIKFTTQKLAFENISISTSETNPAISSASLEMDVTDYGVHLHGAPREGLTIDAKYFTDRGLWQIDKLVYASELNPEWESKLSGTIGKGGELNLKISGTFDTSLLAYLRGFVREAKGPLTLNDLHVGGTTKDASLSGGVSMHDNDISLRNWHYFIDHVNGDINFNGHSISLPKLTGRIEYGDFTVAGSANHQNNKLSYADVKLDARSITYVNPDKAFRAEIDCDLAFKGSPSSSNFSGAINILNGRYTKNLSVFEKLKQPSTYQGKPPSEPAWKDIKLALKIKDTGDLKLDNNVGEIWLGSDLVVTGTNERPNITGNIEATGGEIHYAGMNFDVTRGHVEFSDPYTNPLVELVGAKEVGNYNVTLTISGKLDKLYFDIESTPPLERKDVLALLSVGTTEADLEGARYNLNRPIGTTGLVAEQVGAVLEGPVRKYTPIDSFRVGSAMGTSGAAVTRLSMGKDISDRLKLVFITDISSQDAQQILQAEYLITDFMLLKGARMSNTNYRFNLTFRFREQ